MLRVTAKHKSVSFPAVYVTQRGKAAIAWTVPANAPSGEWTFSAQCRLGHKVWGARKRLLLINHGSGTGGLVAPNSTHLGEGAGLVGGGKGGEHRPCAPVTRGSPPSEECFYTDPYDFYEDETDIGQCTWYAAGRRPDLDGITTGNAWEWLGEAEHHGVHVGTSPVAGAIAVNTTYSAEGHRYGHVAYVERVVNSTTLIVDEANVQPLDIWLHQEVSTSEFQGYIYGGPAGNGPGSGSGGSGGGSSGGGGSAGGGSPPPGPPTGPAAASDSTPGTVLDQATRLVSVFTLGANNSLDDYFVTSGQSWQSAVVAGSGQAYSKPAAAIEESSGLISVFVQGPDNSLDDYFATPGQPWSLGGRSRGSRKRLLGTDGRGESEHGVDQPVC